MASHRAPYKPYSHRYALRELNVYLCLLRGLLALTIVRLDESAATADGDHQTLVTQYGYRRAYRAARYSLLLL